MKDASYASLRLLDCFEYRPIYFCGPAVVCQLCPEMQFVHIHALWAMLTVLLTAAIAAFCY